MLIVAEQAGCFSRVDKRCFAMVNMGDNGDISQHKRLFIGRKNFRLI